MSKDQSVSIVRQDVDQFYGVKTVFSGKADQLKPRFPGDIQFNFKDEEGEAVVTFDFISSVLYSHELLFSSSSFPLKETQYEWGLYEVENSKLIDRIRDNWLTGGTFKNNRHFVYSDDEFLWHITCAGITIKRS